MNKTLVFDMDGTIADLYGVDNWLDDLQNENTHPYDVADPMYDMDSLASILNILKDCGWRIVVTTWLSKNGSQDYNNAVRSAKLAWLDRYNFPYDEIHLVKYGTTKANCTRKWGGYQVLVDDNEKVRNGWTLGKAVDANENIMEYLTELLFDEWGWAFV